MGRLISINGPSFSGKTFLSSKLTNYFVDNSEYSLSNVSFESIFDKNGNFTTMSKEYRELVQRKLDKFDIVIAESTIIKFVDGLHIVCLPDVDTHVNNYEIYKKKFGIYDAIKRSYWNDIIKMRKEFNKLYKLLAEDYLLDMSNDSINECYQEVLRYVSNK